MLPPRIPIHRQNELSGNKGIARNLFGVPKPEAKPEPPKESSAPRVPCPLTPNYVQQSHYRNQLECAPML